MSSSGMCRCVDLVLADGSEERIASIFKVEKSASGEQAWAGGSHNENQMSKFVNLHEVRHSESRIN
jgi:hypothetical protein